MTGTYEMGIIDYDEIPFKTTEEQEAAKAILGTACGCPICVPPLFEILAEAPSKTSLMAMAMAMAIVFSRVENGHEEDPEAITGEAIMKATFTFVEHVYGIHRENARTEKKFDDDAQARATLRGTKGTA